MRGRESPPDTPRCSAGSDLEKQEAARRVKRWLRSRGPDAASKLGKIQSPQRGGFTGRLETPVRGAKKALVSRISSRSASASLVSSANLRK